MSETWETLTAAAETSMPESGDFALMMSAGWDSRTLLALLTVGSQPNLNTYTHGDLESRELGIAGQIARARGVGQITESIDARIFDPGLMDRAFRRTENLVFMHWHRAASVMADRGISAAVSGVYGGVLGGHYGVSTLMSDGRKMRTVLSLLAGRGAGVSLTDRQDVLDFLILGTGSLPWYLDPTITSEREYREQINADISATLDRLQERGITNPEFLVEAFLVETRGAQYMNAQNLALRSSIDVFNPFAVHRALRLAASIPLRAKIHNRINRQMLQRFAPDLLRYPLAATLVSAHRPLLLQEASRLARKLWETRRWERYFDSRGARAQPRLGWVNFEFLRDGRVLKWIVDSLQSDLWNRQAMSRYVERVVNMEISEQLHPTFDQFGKILTVDRILSATGQRLPE